METMLENKLLIDKSKWKSVKFGDVVFEPKESSNTPVEDGIEHVVGLEHIISDDIHLRESNSIEEATTFTKRFSKGDVLFGRRRAYLKKAAIAHFSGICSGDITVFRTKENLLPELLPFVVHNEKFFDYAIKHSAGGLSPRVKFKDLANYEFLLPPKDQQAKLAELLWAMDEVIERNLKVLKSLELNYSTIIKSIFNNEKGLVKLKEIKFKYFKGISADESDKGTFYLIPSGGVFPRYLKNDKIKKVNLPKAGSFSKTLAENDILFNTGGVGTLGRSHYFTKENNKYLCDSFVLVLRFNDRNFLNKYIYHIFQSSRIHSQIIQNTKGTTGITSISIEGIENFKIPSVNLEEQSKFVKTLDNLELVIFDVEKKSIKSKALQNSFINQIL